MMDKNELSQEYIPAQGPDGLAQVLEDLLVWAKQDPTFAADDHYILYQLGGQRSLIRVDTSQPPFQFWYFDLMGRPATETVKETIAKFLWEKCGEKERFYKEFQGG